MFESELGAENLAKILVIMKLFTVAAFELKHLLSSFLVQPKLQNVLS